MVVFTHSKNDVPKDVGDINLTTGVLRLVSNKQNEMISFNVGVGYLANMTGVQSVQDYVATQVITLIIFMVPMLMVRKLML